MSLRNQVLSSVKWLAAGRFVGQVASWMITLVVIRILEPSDYGLMSLALIMIGFAGLFRDMGLYSALVQRRELTQRQIEQSFGLLFVGNSAVYGLLFLSAPLVAEFFGDERLVTMIRVLGVQFPLASVGVVQDALLSRQMAFKPKSFVNLAATLSNGFVTLGCALAGLGVWALVFGSISGALVRPVGLIIAAGRWYRPRFAWAGMGNVASFGGLVTATRLLWYFYMRSSVVIIGKLLGQETLGFYSVAAQIATLPMNKLTGLLNQVSLAAYSSIQEKTAVVRSHYLKVVRVMSFCAFPVFFGISSVAPEFVTVVLGEQWLPTIVPLQLLSLVAPLQMLSTTNGSVLEAIGKPRIGTENSAIACIVMPSAFFIGAYYGGLVGVCLAWAVAFPLLMLIWLKRILPLLDLTLRDYLASMSKPALAAGVMYAVVTAAREWVAEPFLRPSLGLVFLVGTGAVTYMVCMYLLGMKESREVMALIRR